jgi:putative CocE/NonD family hydrolase
MRRIQLTAIALAALLTSTAVAQTVPGGVTPMTPEMNPTYSFTRPDADYVRKTVMIPMRDGKRLFTVIVMRKGTTNAPILFTRTPYNADRTTSRTPSQRIIEILPVMDAEFVNDNYIRVYQDVRGRNKSEGDFVMNRPIIGPLNTTTVDESTDAYDSIEWLTKNVPETNGKVGITGSSYVGFTALVATINPHPALKASVPQSPMVDGWMGDDWFHNGAFRQPNFDYITNMTTNAGDNDDVANGVTGDDYVTFLKTGSAGDYARKWGLDAFPFAQKLMQNPAYTEFWSQQAVDTWFKNKPLVVPTMLVVGQWDQEDSYGAPKVYHALEPKDGANDKLHLVIGPWRHSGVNYIGDRLGPYMLPGDTALDFRTRYMKPFLDHYLKGTPDPKTPPVITYATGINRWDESKAWPMGQSKPLYLGPNGTLSFDKPAKDEHDDYVSDPSKPVPFMPRPVHMRDADAWRTWLIRDQRFVSGRTDVLEYETAVLDKDVHIMGAPMVDLFAATSGTDSDFVVKLIDVYPDDETYHPENAGMQMGVAFEIFRGRYVRSFAKPEALKPGKVENYKFGLPNVDHVFLKGHKIMVQVQSTLFPLYDRNPQSYVSNIFDAKPGDYKKATQSIYRGPKAASSVILPVVGN